MVIKNNKIILNTILKEKKNNQLINYDYFMRDNFYGLYLLYLIILFYFIGIQLCTA